ncbi:MAG TPA: alkaline phosphatase family protein [Candidatus Acidoferrum sp.]|nr:alkaline phosphatase family protein [Candidatus Acidoferrum sp.]
MRKHHKVATGLVALSGALVLGVSTVGFAAAKSHDDPPVQGTKSATPIKHLVVIFDENVSFDHYFGTYPFAANLPGETPFDAAKDTPSVNGLYNQVINGQPSGPLLTHNGNLSNPMRLAPSDAMTCDQDHAYTDEQSATDHGAEDLYVQDTGRGLTLAQCLANENAGLTSPSAIPAGASNNDAVMDYYDGNTVTALWNYAQHYAMSDNAYTTTYGPSTPGALSITSAQTYGALCGPASATINDSPCSAPPGYSGTSPVASAITTSANGPTSVANQPAAGPGTTYSDADPTYDICSYLEDGKTPAATLTMGGNNVGQELTTAGLTWGWFQGGFDDGYVPRPGTTQPTTAQICTENHKNVGGATQTDYDVHHEPFQYYASTANPMHLPPTSVAMIGHSDQANHQYDTADFWAAVDGHNLPAVSYLKAPNYQDGHAGYSDPTDEQNWIASTVNHLESSPQWKSTAVIVTYDDSDGWYDHVEPPLVTSSQTPLDTLTGPGACGSPNLVPVSAANQPEEGRCGLGVRIPFLVISPFAKRNVVANNIIDQSSVVRFIENNWSLPPMGNGAADASAGSLAPLFSFHDPHNAALLLDPATGAVVPGDHGEG